MLQRTYAVAWSEDLESFVGKLAFGAAHVRLEGRSPDGREGRRLLEARDLDEVTGIRSNGRRAITLSWRGRGVRINVIDGAGAFGEVLDELRSLTATPPLLPVAPPPFALKRSGA